ncbi:MAG: adenosylcobinamide-GDP ribazoletransferase [Desulfovibrio sp.]|nr:adenosylcobinamide-GDP ribazoletransferase [Desulfovibrio sp.]
MLSSLIAWASAFRDALVFLTQLVPSREDSIPNNFPATVFFFAPVGFVVGSLLTLAAWMTHLAATRTTGNDLLAAFLAAWVWLALNIWITRGLHWDGLADLGDATGSMKHGEQFRLILKDSRLGTFGALQVLLVFIGQWLAIAGHLYESFGHLFLLMLASTWTRSSAIWLASGANPHTDAGLGRLMCMSISSPVRRAYMLLAVFMLILPALAGICLWSQMLITGLLQYLLLRRLWHVAKREGGLSGDFFGACMEVSQLCFLLGTL